MFKVIVSVRVLALWGLLILAAFACRSSLAARPGITFLDVTNTDDSGPGSLRQTILDANGTGGLHVQIEFAIPGAGPFTINVPSPLPAATRSIDFDGSAQSITIQGSGSGSGNGLDLRFGGSVNGLRIRGFGNGIYVQDTNVDIANCVIGGNGTGIYLLNVNSSTVKRCKIGTNAAGDTVDENMIGIQIYGGQFVSIGVGDGASAVDANLISGNRIGGIYAEGTSGPWFAQNTFGTNLAGTAPLPNPYNDEAPGLPDPDTNVYGIKLVSCDLAQVGESGPWIGNLITGFQTDICLEGCTHSVIRRNFLGLNRAGDTPIPNPFAYWGPGAPIAGIDAPDSHGNQVFNGTDVSMHACTNVVVEHCVLANSTRYGVDVNGCNSCRLNGNLIGTTTDGYTPAGGTNGEAMVFFRNGTGNAINGADEDGWAPSYDLGGTVVCAFGNGTDMIAESNETLLQINANLGFGLDGVTPIGHAHVFLNVGGSTLTNNKSTGIALEQTVIPNCDRAICVSDLAEPQGFADTFNPFGSYDPTWSNDRISWPALDAASTDGIIGHYQLPAGLAVTFNFYRSDAPGSFALAGSYSLSAADNLGTGTFFAPVGVGVGQIMYAATIDANGSTSEFSEPVTGTPNSPPIAVAGPIQTVAVAHDGNPATNTAAVTLDGSGSSDPDAGQTLTYLWKDQTNTVVGNTAQISLSLTSGTYNYSLTVTDPFGRASTSLTAVIVTGEPNGTPSSIAGTNHTITVAPPGTTATVALDGSGSSDPDSDTLSYSWSDGQGVIGTTPTLSLVKGFGTYVFTLTVTDPYGATASASVTIIVNTSNQSPTAVAGGNQTLTLATGQTTAPFTLNGSASTDPEHEALTYCWKEGATVVGSTASVSLSRGIGTYTFTLTVTDPEGATSSASVVVTVTSGNHPPIAVAGSNQTLTVLHDGNPSTNTVSVSLNGSASNDPDAGQTLTYQWLDGNNNLVGSSASVTRTLTPGSYVFTLTVTDPQGASNSASVTVIVNAEPNSPPTVNAGGDKTVTADCHGSASVSITATVSDPDHDTVTTKWYEGATQIGTGVTLTKTFAAGVHTLTVTSTDSYGAATSDTVVVNVWYAWGNFLTPIDCHGTSSFNQGNPILVSFFLCGVSIGAAPDAHLYVAKVTNGVVGAETPAKRYLCPTGDNAIGHVLNLYFYVMATNNLSKGTWRLRVDLGDGDPNLSVLVTIK